MDLVRIAVMGLQEAKDLQKECLEAGVEIVLNHNDETCNRGCAVTVELHAQEKDIPFVQNLYSQKYAKLLEGHDVDFDAMNSVYDPNASEATCPACSTKFSPQLKECPECGLVLG